MLVRLSKLSALVVISMLFFTSSVIAQPTEDDVTSTPLVDENEQAEESTEEEEEVIDAETITVYVDVSWGARTTKAAKNLSKSHLKYNELGYFLQDIDLYNENGDLRGFFVTYRKKYR